MKPLYIMIAVVVLGVSLSSVYTVSQVEQALIVQFGEPVSVVKEPGLHFKIPMVQEVVKFDNRILDLNAEPKELIASDQKRVIVDAFAKYRIIDPLNFYRTVRNEFGMQTRLNSIMDSRLREVLGAVPLSTLLTGERVKVMATIRNNVNSEVKDFGIEVVDVRIMRADLPQKNSEAIYLRMQTERQREAKEFRSIGAEEAIRITSKADKERTVIIAEAERDSQVIRGKGEAEATKIFAEAFAQDKEFYSFYRTMQVYRETLQKDDTTMVLSPNSDFLKYFQKVDANSVD